MLDFKAMLLGFSLFHFLSTYVFWARIYSHDPPLEICCGAGFGPLLMVLCSFVLLFGRIWTNALAAVIGSLFIYDNSYQLIANQAAMYEISVWDAVAQWWDIVSSDLLVSLYLSFGTVVVACAIGSTMKRVAQRQS